MRGEWVGIQRKALRVSHIQHENEMPLSSWDAHTRIIPRIKSSSLHTPVKPPATYKLRKYKTMELSEITARANSIGGGKIYSCHCSRNDKWPKIYIRINYAIRQTYFNWCNTYGIRSNSSNNNCVRAACKFHNTISTFAERIVCVYLLRRSSFWSKECSIGVHALLIFAENGEKSCIKSF